MREVWKVTDTIYKCVDLKRPNKMGASRRITYTKSVSWSARVDGRVVAGFGTRRAALAAFN